METLAEAEIEVGSRQLSSRFQYTDIHEVPGHANVARLLVMGMGVPEASRASGFGKGEIQDMLSYLPFREHMDHLRRQIQQEQQVSEQHLKIAKLFESAIGVAQASLTGLEAKLSNPDDLSVDELVTACKEGAQVFEKIADRLQHGHFRKVERRDTRVAIDQQYTNNTDPARDGIRARMLAIDTAQPQDATAIQHDGGGS